MMRNTEKLGRRDEEYWDTRRMDAPRVRRLVMEKEGERDNNYSRRSDYYGNEGRSTRPNIGVKKDAE